MITSYLHVTSQPKKHHSLVHIITYAELSCCTCHISNQYKSATPRPRKRLCHGATWTDLRRGERRDVHRGTVEEPRWLGCLGTVTSEVPRCLKKGGLWILFSIFVNVDARYFFRKGMTSNSENWILIQFTTGWSWQHILGNGRSPGHRIMTQPAAWCGRRGWPKWKNTSGRRANQSTKPKKLVKALENLLGSPFVSTNAWHHDRVAGYDETRLV